jgi:hypothetical protein
VAPSIREVLVIPNGSTTQQVVTSGVGTVSGDTFVVIQCTDGNTVTDPTSTAGTLTQRGTTETDGNGNGLLKLFTTNAGSGGAKTVTFPAAGGFDILGVVLVMSGTCTSDGFTKVHFTSSGTSFITPAVTLANANDLLGVACFAPGNTTFDFSASGLTQQAQSTALPFSSLGVATVALTLSGTSPTYTVTTSIGIKAGIIAFGLTAAVTTVNGTATAPLGALVGAATGVPTVLGTAARALGALTATATGIPTVIATGAGPLGALTATATGTPTVLGVATGPLGGLTGHAGVAASVTGTATGPLGRLVGHATQETTARGEQGNGAYGLLGILAEMREMRAQDATQPEVACPNDGEPLRSGPNGVLYCPFDGYRSR